MQSRGSPSILLALAAVAVALLLVSTGATVFDQPADRIDDRVALQPAPDNDYTYLDGDGELVIDVTGDNPYLDADGVNVNALTAVDPLFYVTYDGDAYADVWIDHGEFKGAVTFTIDGHSAASAGEPVRLTPDHDRVPVGVAVDTRVAEVVAGDRLSGTVSVHALPADERESDPYPTDDPAVDAAAADDGDGDDAGGGDGDDAGSETDSTDDATRLALDDDGDGLDTDLENDPESDADGGLNDGTTGGDAADGDAADDAAAGPDSDGGDPVEEPGALGLEEVVGVLVLLGIVLATGLLFRRMPRW
ncbi:hypothetical protein GRS48_04245 [Halorubrum sp. JWXQ-INN 858]|uniref:hypothetical protein n=1 Tax=Halorubrum sp. JWXQ-INN 858 TaxID=2690782 RepID=UPI00135980BF|nr:hypothetical protein [Halorubrum sp. JWXQ-INN 858]MWV64036.1 hypothetical protein [Halorubrum sp. JWXQ-INN 858]